MSSDASQSILRLTLLASATAAFMVVWAGDSSRTLGMSLAERNRHIVPAHALDRPATSIAHRTVAAPKPVAAIQQPSTTHPDTQADLQSLPAGSYRVVFGDGRVEWLTVIDRQAEPAKTAPAVLSTTLRGEPAHLIRVTDRPIEATVR
ncbi:MAG TPA: hypothetical protein VM452_07880 [Caulifigura sp.]|jgi:hypothetical protein|nr:hypothetical protein [Caulifigura sp.]